MRKFQIAYRSGYFRRRRLLFRRISRNKCAGRLRKMVRRHPVFLGRVFRRFCFVLRFSRLNEWEMVCAAQVYSCRVRCSLLRFARLGKDARQLELTILIGKQFIRPTEPCHVHAAIPAKGDALPFQQQPLLSPTGNRPSAASDHAVAGKISWRSGQSLSNSAGQGRKACKPCNFTVGYYASERDLPHDFVYFVIELFCIHRMSCFVMPVLFRIPHAGRRFFAVPFFRICL